MTATELDSALAAIQARTLPLSVEQAHQLAVPVKRLKHAIAAVEADMFRAFEAAKTSTGRSGSDEMKDKVGQSKTETEAAKNRAKLSDDDNQIADECNQAGMSTGHLDLIAAVTARLGIIAKQLFMTRKTQLLAAGATMSVEEFKRHLGQVITQVETEAGINRANQQKRDTKMSLNLDPISGMWKGFLQLHPELGAIISQGLDTEIARLQATNPGDTRDQLRAKALHQIILHHTNKTTHTSTDTGNTNTSTANTASDDTSNPNTASRSSSGHPDSGKANRSGTTIGSTQPKADVIVVVDENGSMISQGANITAEDTARLACNSIIHYIAISEAGAPLNYGTTRRLASQTQRAILRALYTTCPIPGCATAFDSCEIHHIIEWEHHGRTDINNLIPLCKHHHHTLHDNHWTIKLGENRELTITHPDKQTILNKAPPPRAKPQTKTNAA